LKVVILAGGRGSRLAELTGDIPKPLVKIGDMPMLQHIMRIYAYFGYSDFLIAGGYKIGCIDEWLAGAYLPYNVQLIDTGLETFTGGRVAKLAKYLGERFMLTYGDGVSDVDLNSVMMVHKYHESYCTVTAVHPPSRFGNCILERDYVINYNHQSLSWINGGFFVCEPEALDYIHGDEAWESGALARMTEAHLLTAYRHEGFWQCMDTLHDKEILETAWNNGKPWRKE
jgi:glucose-1-phosphate cytidylyltransferase